MLAALRRRPRLVWSLYFLALFLLLALRRPGCLTRPEFWAEDGHVWFCEQAQFGWRALFRSFTGYWQLGARVIAAASAFFPLRWAPFLYTFLSLLIAAACCGLFALPHFRRLLASDALRCTLGVLAACAFYSTEMHGTPTNLQWYLLLAGVLLAVLPPGDASVRAWLVSFVLGFFLAGANPVVLIALPIAVAGWIWQRRRPAAFHFGLALGLVMQMRMAFGQPELHRAMVPSAGQMPALALAMLRHWSYHAVLSPLIGEVPTRLLAERVAGTCFGVVLGVVMLTFVVAFCLQLDRQRRWQVVGATYLAFAGFALPILLRGGAAVIFTSDGNLHHFERFNFVPAFTTAYIIALAVERWPTAWLSRNQDDYIAARRAFWRAALLLGVLFLGGIIANARVRSLAPSEWTGQVAEVERWMSDRDAGRASAAVSIAIDPVGWQVNLPAIASAEVKR